MMVQVILSLYHRDIKSSRDLILSPVIKFSNIKSNNHRSLHLSKQS